MGSETIVRMMTPDEAQRCASEIKRGMADVRHLLLDFYEREGWRALGYANWRECAMAEFGYEQSHVYRLLDAARVERNISPTGENIIPERHLRPLVEIAPPVQREVWQRAVETAPEGKVTAKHVKRTVTAWKNDNRTELGNRGDKHIDELSLPPAPSVDSDAPDIVTVRVARVIYLMMVDDKVRRNPDLWFDLRRIAEIANISENGAWRAMQKIIADHYVPLTEMDGKYGIPPRDWSY